LAISPTCAGAAGSSNVPRYALRRVYGEQPGPRAVIVTLGTMRWRDITGEDMPNLRRLAERGAVGLLPAAAPHDRDPFRTWVSLGAGRAGVGTAAVGEVETAGLGLRQKDMAGLAAANLRAGTRARPGYLGGRLHAVGLSTAVIGCTPRTRGIAILMDEDGQADGGQVLDGSTGALLRPERRGAIRDAFLAALKAHDVVLLDLGDATAGLGTKGAFLEGADAVIGDVIGALEGHEAVLWFLSPISPSYLRGEWIPDLMPMPPVAPELRTLAPAVMFEFGGDALSGLLTSSSTRWPGLVAAADFAPTLLAWWGIDSAAGEATAGGRRMRVVAAEEPLDRLGRLDRMLTEGHRLRFVVVKWYAVYAFIVLLAGLGFAIRRPRWLRFLGGPGLALALAPVGLLLCPLAGSEKAWVHLLVAGAITAALTLAATRGGEVARGTAAVMLVGSGLIALDVVLGSPLMRRSVLGFGVMFGSRFYGIGNEYMGVLVGMTAVGVGALLQVVPRAHRIGAGLGAAVVLVIGLPFLGANWGGSFTAASGLVVLWLVAAPRRWPRAVATAGLVLVTAIALPAALDLLRPAWERSHIGGSAAALLAGEFAGITGIVGRKLAMNWRVVAYTPWVVVVASVSAAALWALLREGGPARRSLARQPMLAAGIAAALVAGAVAMVVNDSGLVAGAGAVSAAFGSVLLVASRAVEAEVET
jgi:hypothetical protein